MTVPLDAAVAVRAPAKVNLVLGVGPRRPDGFHDLATLYYAVALFDDVIAHAEPDGAVRLVITGDQPGIDRLPTDERNLVVRAARLLAREHGVPGGVSLRLHKRIPLQAGLAGGSSDAAATLVACNRLWGLRLPVERLAELAAHLGSDVAFCLYGRAALGGGRGELVTPVPVAGRQHWVLVLADGGLSTPAMYRALDDARTRGRARPPTVEVPAELLAALAAGDAERVGAALTNDLQPPALAARPDLGEVLAVARGAGALGALVSGSGPTCAVLAADGAAARAIARTLGAAGLGRQLLVTHGPAPGAAG